MDLFLQVRVFVGYIARSRGNMQHNREEHV